ncbi:MAG: STAS domain-containing protein [Chloroflexi bacterium]|nr:STAS domain-containing protein [Chloroflexota bacterium]MBI3734443.1 STAS domain-containing protein [Chloroflexota bacterium]
MEISTKELARVNVVEVKGRVDHDSAPDLHKTLDELVQARRYNIVVDLSGVDYMSSGGLKALLSAHKNTQGRQRGDVRLVGPSALVAETLKLVGFDRIFKIYPQLVDAVGSF